MPRPKPRALPPKPPPAARRDRATRVTRHVTHVRGGGLRSGARRNTAESRHVDGTPVATSAPHDADQRVQNRHLTRPGRLASPFPDRYSLGSVPSDVFQRTLVGRYLLLDELGSGGMATVCLARLEGPAGFARLVAMKRLHAHVARDEAFVCMLLDEARLAARIRHSNVAQIQDVVVTPAGVALVFDYVHGETLARLSRAAASGSLPHGIASDIAARIVTDVLRGLHAAHEAKSELGEPLGIVHRDVSPQNVIVGADGSARVLDFGIAKAAGRLQTTREGQIKGKLAYMAPEQIVGGDVDRRTDVFACGILFWELLAGERLYDGGEGEVVWRVKEAIISPLHVGVRPELAAIAMHALARSPADRFATAAEMADALEPFAAKTSTVASWVEDASPSLEARTRRLADVEQTTASYDATPRPEAEAEAEAERTVSAVIDAPMPRHYEVAPTLASVETPWERPRGSRARPILLAVATTLATAGVLVGIWSHGRTTAAAETQTAVLAASAPPPTSASPADGDPPAPATSVADPATPPALLASSSATRPPPKTMLRPPRPKSECVPYLIDADGNKQYNRRCLQ